MTTPYRSIHPSSVSTRLWLQHTPHYTLYSSRHSELFMPIFYSDKLHVASREIVNATNLLRKQTISTLLEYQQEEIRIWMRFQAENRGKERTGSEKTESKTC